MSFVKRFFVFALILGFPLLIVSPSLAQQGGQASQNANPGGEAPLNTNKFYRISVETNNALAVGIFSIGTECDDTPCVTSLTAVRFANLTDKSKPDVLCTDFVCSPLERDIITVAVGGDLGTAFGLSGGYAGVADAEVHWQLNVGVGAGLEFEIKGPMKIKPAENSDFQSGGNLLAESGLGATMFDNHVMVGMRRLFGITGNVSFYGENSPNTVLMAGALSQDGTATCVDEVSAETPCPTTVLDLLEDLCDDQARCSVATEFSSLAVVEPRFGGLDPEELDEALEEARSVIELIEADIRDRAIVSRLNDIRELFAQLRDNEIRGTIRTELANGIASQLDDVLGIVSSNTRFGEINLARIEQLPDSQDITEAIAELLSPLLSDIGETSASTKARFCATAIGQRRVFDTYCGR